MKTRFSDPLELSEGRDFLNEPPPSKLGGIEGRAPKTWSKETAQQAARNRQVDEVLYSLPEGFWPAVCGLDERVSAEEGVWPGRGRRVLSECRARK